MEPSPARHFDVSKNRLCGKSMTYPIFKSQICLCLSNPGTGSYIFEDRIALEVKSSWEGAV